MTRARDSVRVLPSSLLLFTRLFAQYLGIREKILEEETDRMEKTKTKYENIKNSCVSVDGNVIKIGVPLPPKAMEKKVKKEDEKKEVNGTKKKEGKEEVVGKVQPVHPIMRKRTNRGRNAFDIFVGVRGFNQHIRNMGKATDMDVCNYFIHNHKDVADVKFVNWTDIVFAKFKSPEAAERFISLSYHMFYGIDLNLHDVPEFLKKKTDQQKDEVARVLLGKKFNQVGDCRAFRILFKPLFFRKCWMGRQVELELYPMEPMEQQQ